MISRPGTWPEGPIGLVPMLLLPATSTARRSLLSSQAPSAVAMAFSMIVEMTSLTPRRTLSSPAIAAHPAPTSTATKMISAMCSGAGRVTAPPTAAAVSAARRYWPSTPMLKRFILNPIATASADR